MSTAIERLKDLHQSIIQRLRVYTEMYIRPVVKRQQSEAARVVDQELEAAAKEADHSDDK